MRDPSCQDVVTFAGTNVANGAPERHGATQVPPQGNQTMTAKPYR
jgi:hypothetical protein